MPDTTNSEVVENMTEHEIRYGKVLKVMDGVREHAEGDPVELLRLPSGRLAIRAYNEGHNNCTEIDLADLLDWLEENNGLDRCPCCHEEMGNPLLDQYMDDTERYGNPRKRATT